jgi:hypothetical protein
VELCLWRGWLLAMVGQFDAAEELLRDLERAASTWPRPARSMWGAAISSASGTI